jgi:hypothetical protein
MRPAEEIFSTFLSEEDDDSLFVCNAEFNEKQEQLHNRWLADGERYDVDFARGVLRITRRSGPPVLFDVTMVGSHDRAGRSWEWAWNNPNVVASLALPESALAETGRDFNLKYLVTGFIPVPMDSFPWYLCGTAMKATGALCAYVASDRDMDYYMLLDNPRECET